MTTTTALDVPADPRWRHVVAATVLAAVRASGGPSAGEDVGSSHWGQGELGRMGDLSLLLDRALDDIDSLAGVSTLSVKVESDGGRASVSVTGEGEDVERPAQATTTPFVDRLTGLKLEWSPTAVKCSFSIGVRPP